MTVALIVVGVVIGALLLLGLVSVIDRRAREEAVDAARQQVHLERVSSEYRYAWEALHGLPRRLELLSDASEQVGRTYRADAITGGRAWQLFNASEYAFEPPAELQDSSAHPGALDGWQAPHRALHRLSAVHAHDDPGVQADAHEQVATAAAEVSQALADRPMPIDLNHCWFCDRPSTEVRLLANSRATICDECVQQCYGEMLDR